MYKFFSSLYFKSYVYNLTLFKNNVTTDLRSKTEKKPYKVVAHILNISNNFHLKKRRLTFFSGWEFFLHSDKFNNYHLVSLQYQLSENDDLLAIQLSSIFFLF